MAEGKTLGTPGVKCECCEEVDSSHFCCDCTQPLCTRCTELHGRIASTKLHKPIPIEQYKSLASTTRTTDSSKAYCAKHPGKTIEKLCEDCLVVVCSDCEPDHTGHRLTYGILDANILQRVSVQKIPGLVEIIQKLRDLDDGAPGKITLYKEAEKLVNSWKNELLDLINRDADQLLRDLHNEIKKQETISAKTSTKIQECIAKTDQHIAKLSESRKVSSSTKLLERISKCDEDIEDVKMYLEKVKASHSQEKLEMADILPGKAEFDKTRKMMRSLFTKTSKGQPIPCKIITAGPARQLGHTKSRHYNKLEVVCVVSLPYRKWPLYRICAINELESICIFHACGNIVQVFDMNLRQTASYKCSKNILRVASLVPNKFVIVEYIPRNEPQNVYSVDERFSNVLTIHAPMDGYKARGMCPIDVNVMIISEENIHTNSTSFKEIRVNGDKVDVKLLCKVNTENWNGLMAYQDSGHLIYAATSKTFCKIDLLTGISTHFCTTAANTTSLCIDGNTVLFGDIDGTIHKIEDGKDSAVILKVPGYVTGLLTNENGIVVVSGTKMAHYQFQ